VTSVDRIPKPRLPTFFGYRGFKTFAEDDPALAAASRGFRIGRFRSMSAWSFHDFIKVSYSL
jgi:hypothetical protein